MDTFRCGHEKTAENTAKNGKQSSGACRTCHRARDAARRATAEGRESARLRMAKWRGVEPGRSRGVYHASLTECPAGHPYDEENTYVFNGVRQCKQCRRQRTTDYYHQKRSNGGTHTQAEWLAVCAAHGNVCAHCRLDRPLTRDHIIPVSKGGSNDIANIQPLCRQCNASKKDKIVLKGAQ